MLIEQQSESLGIRIYTKLSELYLDSDTHDVMHDRGMMCRNFLLTQRLLH